MGGEFMATPLIASAIFQTETRTLSELERAQAAYPIQQAAQTFLGFMPTQYPNIPDGITIYIAKDTPQNRQSLQFNNENDAFTTELKTEWSTQRHKLNKGTFEK